MYNSPNFTETRVDVMHNLMRACPLASLVAMTSTGLVANHIPLLIIEEPTPYGTLQGHMARANPLWRTFEPQTEVLSIFQGSNAYINPSWYPTKQETGKAVPTWNYAVVHAYGTLRIIDDVTWVRDQIERLTAISEAESTTPWRITDAPPAYIDNLLNAVIGFEITITRIEGKWKASQNQPDRNKDGVIDGLVTRQRPHDQEMANLVIKGKTSL